MLWAAATQAEAEAEGRVAAAPGGWPRAGRAMRRSLALPAARRPRAGSPWRQDSRLYCTALLRTQPGTHGPRRLLLFWTSPTSHFTDVTHHINGGGQEGKERRKIPSEELGRSTCSSRCRLPAWPGSPALRGSQAGLGDPRAPAARGSCGEPGGARAQPRAGPSPRPSGGRAVPPSVSGRGGAGPERVGGGAGGGAGAEPAAGTAPPGR